MHQATKAPFVLFLRYLCLIVLLGCSPLSRNCIFECLLKNSYLYVYIYIADVSTQPVNNTSELKCALCNQMVNDIFDEFRNGMGNKELSVIIGQRCEALNIFNFKVCNGTASIIMVMSFIFKIESVCIFQFLISIQLLFQYNSQP